MYLQDQEIGSLDSSAEPVSGSGTHILLRPQDAARFE
jgi:hypothetical protein